MFQPVSFQDRSTDPALERQVSEGKTRLQSSCDPGCGCDPLIDRASGQTARANPTGKCMCTILALNSLTNEWEQTYVIAPYRAELL